MHVEIDPCVRYDGHRKIWFYLHRNRTEEEFENQHQQQKFNTKKTYVASILPNLQTSGNLTMSNQQQNEIPTTPINTQNIFTSVINFGQESKSLPQQMLSSPTHPISKNANISMQICKSPSALASVSRPTTQIQQTNPVTCKQQFLRVATSITTFQTSKSLLSPNVAATNIAIQQCSSIAQVANVKTTTEIGSSILVSFCDIINYFGGIKRSIRAGEEIVNAGWVYAIGVAPPPQRNRIIGLVMQVSSITSKPHECKLDNLDKQYSMWECICSCKAGAGRKCKHIAACLIQINRNPNMKGISCTELTQKWGKIGQNFAKKFSAICAADMFHTREKVSRKDDYVSEEKEAQYLQKFLKVAPKSELAKLLLGNRSKECGGRT